MPVLLALSILAFVALLWATISIAGFVRRQRRRRKRRAADAGDATLRGPVPSSLAPPPVFYRDPQAAEPVLSAQDAPRPAPAQTAEGSLAHKMEAATIKGSAGIQHEIKDAASTQPIPPAVVAVPAAAVLSSPQPLVAAKAAPVPSATTPLPTPPPQPPPRLRSFPTRLGKHAAAAADTARPPWNPFSKDLADLSDPVASRHVPGPRARNKNPS